MSDDYISETCDHCGQLHRIRFEVVRGGGRGGEVVELKDACPKKAPQIPIPSAWKKEPTPMSKYPQETVKAIRKTARKHLEEDFRAKPAVSRKRFVEETGKRVSLNGYSRHFHEVEKEMRKEIRVATTLPEAKSCASVDPVRPEEPVQVPQAPPAVVRSAGGDMDGLSIVRDGSGWRVRVDLVVNDADLRGLLLGAVREAVLR